MSTSQLHDLCSQKYIIFDHEIAGESRKRNKNFFCLKIFMPTSRGGFRGGGGMLTLPYLRDSTPCRPPSVLGKSIWST